MTGISNEWFAVVVLIIALSIAVCLSTYIFAYRLIQPHLQMMEGATKMLDSSTKIMSEANMAAEDMRQEVKTYMQITKQAEQKVLGLTDRLSETEMRHQQETAALTARYEEVKRMLGGRR